MCVTAGDGKMGDGLCRGTGRGSDEGAIVAAHVRERVVHARPAFADRSAAGHELVAFVRAGQDPGAVVRAYGVDGATVESVAEETRREIERRARAYPGGWPLPELEGRAVWIVD